MNPLPVVTDLPLPPTPVPARVLALVPGASLDADLLQHYTRAARAAGLWVAPQRMRYDRHYAFDCLARTYAAGDDALRSSSARLFSLYQG